MNKIIAIVFVAMFIHITVATPVYAAGVIDSIYEWIFNRFRGLFLFNDDVARIYEHVRSVPKSFGGLWGTLETIYKTAVLPFSYTLLTLFFLLSFLKKSVMFEFMNWEVVISCLLRLLIVKIVMENSLLVIEGIYEVTNLLMANMSGFAIPDAAKRKLLEAKTYAALDSTELAYKSAEFGSKLGYIISMFLAWIVFMVVKIFIYVIVYGRLFKLCIYTLVAPIPLSTLISQEHQDVGIGFTKQFLAVCFQGVIIMVCCIIFLGVQNEVLFDKSGINIFHWLDDAGFALIMSVLLLYTVGKSGEWANRILGAS